MLRAVSDDWSAGFLVIRKHENNCVKKVLMKLSVLNLKVSTATTNSFH